MLCFCNISTPKKQKWGEETGERTGGCMQFSPSWHFQKGTEWTTSIVTHEPSYYGNTAPAATTAIAQDLETNSLEDRNRPFMSIRSRVRLQNPLLICYVLQLRPYSGMHHMRNGGKHSWVHFASCWSDTNGLFLCCWVTILLGVAILTLEAFT